MLQSSKTCGINPQEVEQMKTKVLAFGGLAALALLVGVALFAAAAGGPSDDNPIGDRMIMRLNNENSKGKMKTNDSDDESGPAETGKHACENARNKSGYGNKTNFGQWVSEHAKNKSFLDNETEFGEWVREQARNKSKHEHENNISEQDRNKSGKENRTNFGHWVSEHARNKSFLGNDTDFGQWVREQARNRSKHWNRTNFGQWVSEHARNKSFLGNDTEFGEWVREQGRNRSGHESDSETPNDEEASDEDHGEAQDARRSL
jgi:hypothetical protein